MGGGGIQEEGGGHSAQLVSGPREGWAAKREGIIVLVSGVVIIVESSYSRG